MKALAVSLLGWVLVPALALAQPAADLNNITNVRVNGGTVEISGSKKPNFTTFTMTDPPRLVIDIAEATFSGVPEEQQVGNGVVTGIRTASYGSDSSAIARVLIGYEREVETDIQASGNQLIVKVTGGNAGPAVAAAEKPAAAESSPAVAPANSPAGVSAAEATRAANEERQRQEQAAAAAAESARAERAAQDKAAAEATARAQADAEAERKRQDESRAAAQRQEEETRAAAQAAAEERKRQEADARASAQAAAEERKRQDADARAAAQKTAEEERRAAAQAAADAKRQKAEEARAEADARKQAQAEAREAAADEKRQKAEDARAERERRQQEAVAAAETRSRPAASQGSRAAETRHEASSSSGGSEVSSRRKTMTLVGFQQQQGASRVFVRTNEPVRYTVSEQDKQVVLELENTRVEFTNNTRPLDTHFFATAVAKVEADPGANRTVRVTIQLKESARFETRQDGNLITLDFQRPAR
ncbi:AMIN domain-containing protein [Corallococcus sp. H22C18031201]|nr:AMIN domain-containing protein [Corallococcus sp. H22C18031201]